MEVQIFGLTVVLIVGLWLIAERLRTIIDLLRSLSNKRDGQ